MEFLNQIKKLPLSIQSKLISNADEAAHLLSLYSELKKSLREFKNLIKVRKESQTKNEKSIHAFLAENYWLLGVEYFRQVIKTDINPKRERTGETYQKEWRIYPDFEIVKIDKGVDKCVVIELEEANDKVFNKDGSLSKKALDGLFQAITYTIFHNIKKDRVTRGIAILGATGTLTKPQEKKLLKLSNMFPFVEIMTYDDLIENAENVISFLENYQDEKTKKTIVASIEKKYYNRCHLLPFEEFKGLNLADSRLNCSAILDFASSKTLMEITIWERKRTFCSGSRKLSEIKIPDYMKSNVKFNFPKIDLVSYISILELKPLSKSKCGIPECVRSEGI